MLSRMLPHSSYRDWLQQELTDRTQKNPKYSLRAFARDLQVSPASISLILKGRKGLSQKKAALIAKRMGLNELESGLFKGLVLTQSGRTATDKKLGQKLLSQHLIDAEHSLLELDTFKVMSDWYHYAILSVIRTRSAPTTAASISKTLGITEYDAREALARLQRLELIQKKPSGKLVATKTMIKTPNGVPSAALRKYHKQMLEKAFRSIESQTVQERHLNSTLIHFCSSDREQIFSRIEKFHANLIRDFGKANGEADEVYGFCTQFFRATERLNPPQGGDL